jgi:hypothetical protein
MTSAASSEKTFCVNHDPFLENMELNFVFA